MNEFGYERELARAYNKLLSALDWQDDYLQKPCEKRAAEGTLTIDFIEDLLRRYWWLATVTDDEDATIPKYTMPDDWDGKTILSLYETVGIKLVDNPFFSMPQRK